MTGIERLRRLARSQNMENAWTAMLANELCDIADQIENEVEEQSARLYDMRVGEETDVCELFGVEPVDDPLTSLRRHVENLNDTIENLRLELGEARDPAADVSTSAYDLLPQEDRDAIAWVRKHGGLDHVRSQWGYLKGRANHADNVDRQIERRQRQIDECHDALRRRNEDREQYVKANERLLERGAELHRQLLKAQCDALEKDCNLAETKNDIREVCLAHGIDVPSGGDALDAIDMRLHDMQKALDKRPMPEGMEWLVEAWPRFEDGEPVRIGDEVDFDGEGGAASSVELQDDEHFVIHACDGAGDYSHRNFRPGERVKRPAPKVLDADGVEIHVGDRVWSTQLDEPHEWIVIDPHEDRDDSQTVLVSIGDRTGRARPENLTHRVPVLAADGMPLREGDTVWLNDKGLKSKLVDRGEPLKVIAFDEKGNVGVLDRDGIDKGETNPWWFDSSCLTHEHPESKCRDCQYWQKDPAANNMGVCWFFYHEYEGQDCYSARRADIGACDEFVRRSKALAERDAE